MLQILQSERFKRWQTALKNRQAVLRINARLERLRAGNFGDTNICAMASASSELTQLAKDTGLARESLYKALSAEGNPEFATIMKVAKALGLSFSPGRA
ncbi:hypothetical protein ASD15_00415 [Massilia sp. Root351]|jgi:probable addiction module antidote protein|uniref:addiction module antidote protein n=1 Tax=Massilia sp. Root351 TaxID=1736522 RepID=UPI00070FFE85|nr:addiction module antidote protein [Massilia sp. Root351]KQV90590.1 hypothetical protein ASD15_00415 [Massilia sp. Root351]